MRLAIIAMVLVCGFSSAALAQGTAGGAPKAKPRSAAPAKRAVIAASGRLIFVIGEASLLRHGVTQPAKAGSMLQEGDVVFTGEGGKLQLRLVDGAQIALGPQSRIAIAQPQVEGVALQFDAGSLRIVSTPTAPSGAAAPLAAVSAADTSQTPLPRPLIQLRTERVTANIRGAAFTAGYNPDGSVNVATEREPIQVCTGAGCIDLTDEGAVRLRSDTVAPTLTNARPTFR